MQSKSSLVPLAIILLMTAGPSLGQSADPRDSQGYLWPAPIGVDAHYSWHVPGGNGQNVKIYDIERSWGVSVHAVPFWWPEQDQYPGAASHEDLSAAHHAMLPPDPGYRTKFPLATCKLPTGSNPPGLARHGAKVLGILVGDNDGDAVTGVSYGAEIGLVPHCDVNGEIEPGVAAAIYRALQDATAGDVILLEVQWPVCGVTGTAGLGPAEWDAEVYEAIEAAVANGITVVEAAGNGGVYLDQPACQGAFDRAIRDSGAIMVGAGEAPAPYYYFWFLDGYVASSFGSRVDLQGWDNHVWTTSYQFSGSNTNDTFAGGFGGTSAAAPMIAGAAANLQSIAIEHWGLPLDPGYLRDLLVSTGATPRIDHTHLIGPRPDLRAAIETLFDDVEVCGDPNTVYSWCPVSWLNHPLLARYCHPDCGIFYRR